MTSLYTKIDNPFFFYNVKKIKDFFHKRKAVNLIFLLEASHGPALLPHSVYLLHYQMKLAEPDSPN